ncbi:DNA-binding barrel domain superfamily [Sesbania bispinosa]|nr:DNA-binding barrel domain superfamily [Sesbania bispinosa]
MWEPDFDYIMQRWEHFRAKLNSTQLRDPIGNMHRVWVRNIENVGFFREGVRDMIRFYRLEGKHFIDLRYTGDRKFDIQILDSGLLQIQYPPVANEPPIVVPPPNLVAQNEEPPVIHNDQHADIVGWDVLASEAFASGDKPLYIPAHVVEVMNLRRQRSLHLINDAGNRLQATILKRKKRTIRERYLGLGWYEFCSSLQIEVGQTVQFRFYGNSHELRVSVV